MKAVQVLVARRVNSRQDHHDEPESRGCDDERETDQDNHEKSHPDQVDRRTDSEVKRRYTLAFG